MGSALILMIIIVVGIMLYFIPTYIAYNRNTKNKVAILMVNLFLGWMFLGWVGALVWSLVDVNE